MFAIQVLLCVLIGWFAAREAGLAWPRSSRSAAIGAGSCIGAVASFCNFSWAWFAAICSLIRALHFCDQSQFEAITGFAHLDVIFPVAGIVVSLCLFSSRGYWRSHTLPDLLEADWRVWRAPSRPVVIGGGGRGSSSSSSPGGIDFPTTGRGSFNAPSVAYITSSSHNLSVSGADISGGSGLSGIGDGDSDGKAMLVILVIIAAVIAVCLSFYLTRKLVLFYAQRFGDWVERDVERFSERKLREERAGAAT